MAARSRTTLEAALLRWQHWVAAGVDVDRRELAWAAAASVAGAAAQRDGAPQALAAYFTTEHPVPAELVDATLAAVPDAAAIPGVIGQVYEATLSRAERRRAGVFYTPAEVARALVALALEDVEGDDGGLPVVLDPAVGTGAFLLAAAAQLRAQHGAGAARCVAAVQGCDIDEQAVRVAAGALAWWAWLEDGRVAWPAPGALRCADGLAPPALGGPVPGLAQVVVGNPPFLNQLGAGTARSPETRVRLQARFGDAAKGYVDDAALFLLAALEAVAPGGRVLLVQPESTLVTAHGAGVRSRLGAEAILEGLWVGGAGIFAAGVRVCAPLLRKRTSSQVGADFLDSVALWEGSTVAPSGRIDVDSPERRASLFGGAWAPLLGRSRGVPDLTLRSGGVIGDLAAATAGFRDQFYGLVPYVVEHPDPRPAAPVGAAGDQRWAPLITSGSVGALSLRWGERSTRFAGRRWERPAVDLVALEQGDPTLHRWVQGRLRPKLVLATQTSVLLACIDQAGRLVPSVPVISVEPDRAPGEERPGGGPAGDGPAGAEPAGGGGGDDERLWLVAAVLASPVVSAYAAAHFAGAGLSAAALRLSARQVRALPTPVDVDAWREAAGMLRAALGIATKASTNADPIAPPGWHNGARTMAVAYGLDQQGCDQVERWWRSAAGRHAPAMFL